MKDKTQLEQLKEILTFVWEKGVVMDITDNEEIAQQVLDLCQLDLRACERITVIALKYCPKDHHDWEELKALSYKIIPSIIPGESE